MTEMQNLGAVSPAAEVPESVRDEPNPFRITQRRRPAQAATTKPKPITIAYRRSDDGADMVEIGPHQFASLDALLARRLMPSAIKAVEAA